MGGQRGGQGVHQPVRGPASSEGADAEPRSGDRQRPEQEGQRSSEPPGLCVSSLFVCFHVNPFVACRSSAGAELR